MNSSFHTICIGEDIQSYDSLVKETSAEFQKRNVLLFTGAGISTGEPSSLPLAVELIKPLVSEFKKATQLFPELNKIDSKDKNLAFATLEEARLERLLDALYRVYKEPALDYISVLNGDECNTNHNAIAALAKNNFLPVCITLNFDLLIEKAVGSCEIECPLSTPSKIPFGTSNPILRVIKPHGTFTEGDDPYKYLAATLSDIGSEPAYNTIRVISDAIDKSSVLLVAGYSDDDWDIFPILVKKTSSAKRLKKIIWVQYISPKTIERRKAGLDEISERVYNWLSNSNIEAVILIGDIRQFLIDTLESLSITISQPKGGVKKHPDIAPFKADNDPNNAQSIKTALALAYIIHQTGEYSEKLLWLLHNNSIIKNTPHLLWQVEDLLGHMYHTYGKLERAIRHTKQTISAKQHPEVELSVAKDIVWLGYEYLCLSKRPNPLRPLRLIKIPYCIFKGMYLLKKGISLAKTNEERKSLKGLAAYYRVDLLHSWGNILMLFGCYTVRIFAFYFRWIESLYSDIDKNFDVMKTAYYWLRHLETKLLGRKFIDKKELKEIKDRLDELQIQNDLVQNNPQSGNTRAYRALLYYLIDHNMGKAKEEINGSDKEWRKKCKGIASGWRRTVLFKRFIGLKKPTFLDALWLFLKEADAT
ncbi:MAG: SIR2 family protein [Planctomycetes bacterium]|nr:SIR2 family protein [Planctomycetota bacterium]